jgi:mRNA-degrading endonuclease toxin of MazEF toxin-antitoxin module
VYTSVKQKRLSGFDVKVKSTKANGLKMDSVIKTEKIATLQKKTVLGELGILEKHLIKEVDAKLRALFKL